jgi:F-type H+-transporting ATPase subunit gamma
MASTRIIKRRIKSAKNIGQVTRALQMVSAVKMKRAQEIALAGKPYAIELISVLGQISGKIKNDMHPFLYTPKSITKVYLVVIGPEKGLAGSLITNLARKVFLTIDQIKIDYPQAVISGVSFGKKSRDIFKKTGVPIVADFKDQVNTLSSFLIKAYLKHETDLVIIVYSNFINTMTQKPEVIQYLPMGKINNQDNNNQVISFEPSPDEVLDSLLNHYLVIVLQQIVIDSNAAEHSARMVAMKNASDNATDIIKYLTLNYNQTRQSAITNEIADIVSGVML